MQSARSFKARLPKGSTFSARSFVSGSPCCATASPVGKRQKAGQGELPSAAVLKRRVSKSGAHGYRYLACVEMSILTCWLIPVHPHPLSQIILGGLCRICLN